MGTISFGQLLILAILITLLFSDFSKITTFIKKITNTKKLKITIKKNRKKGI